MVDGFEPHPLHNICGLTCRKRRAFDHVEGDSWSTNHSTMLLDRTTEPLTIPIPFGLVTAPLFLELRSRVVIACACGTSASRPELVLLVSALLGSYKTFKIY